MVILSSNQELLRRVPRRKGFIAFNAIKGEFQPSKSAFQRKSEDDNTSVYRDEILKKRSVSRDHILTEKAEYIAAFYDYILDDTKSYLVEDKSIDIDDLDLRESHAEIHLKLNSGDNWKIVWNDIRDKIIENSTIVPKPIELPNY